MRLPVPAAVAVITALALAACAGADAGPAQTSQPGTRDLATSPATGSPTTSAPGSPTSTGTATGAPTPTPGDPGTLTLAFGGDIHFEEYLAPLARDPHGLDELRGSLGAADLAVANLETAITTRGTKIGKEFHFRAPASALETLRNAGIDAVSMANNHGVDYGPVGLQDTLAARRTSPIPIVGIGTDRADALSPAVLHAKGVDVAVFGADQVFEMTLARYSAGQGKPGVASSTPSGPLVAAVAKASREHDVVVVFLHWGTDYQSCPDQLSVQTARALEAAGADIIVGGHSHRVNGAGWLGRSYVHYGLGNFVWWRSREPDSRSGVLTLSVDVAAAKSPNRSRAPVVRTAVWTPMLIGTDGIPRVPRSKDSARLLALWKAARPCTGLAAAPAAR